MKRIAVLFLVAASAAWAQAVVSARSGMVNYVEGQVAIAGQPVKLNGAIFPEVRTGQTLTTEDGHAEVMLTPGVFLRLNDHASFRMLSNKLTETKIEILSGAVMVEALEVLKGGPITVKMGDSETAVVKNGLYHFNADAGRIRTFQGKALVSADGKTVELKKGRALVLASALTPEKFNTKKSKDALYAWSSTRSYTLAAANVPTARGINARGFRTSMWAWSPWLGMFTFLPGSGSIMSPFGYYWYSPATVWIVYAPRTIDTGYSASNSSWQGLAPSSSAASSAPASNASTGAVVRSSESVAAPAASAGGTRGR